MIISPLRPTPSSRPASPAAAAPPTPEAPAEQDLVTIDTPTEVAQLPLLDPAVQLALALSLPTFAGHGVSNLSVATTGGDTEMWLNTRFDGRGRALARGFVGLQESRSHLTLTEKGLHWEGRFGANETSLDMVPEEAAVRITGQIGEVPVALRIEAPEPDVYLTSGTLGEAEYSLKSVLKDDSQGFLLSARGKVGEREIKKDYRSHGSGGESGATLAFSGSGQVGEAQQTVRVYLDMVRPI